MFYIIKVVRKAHFFAVVLWISTPLQITELPVLLELWFLVGRYNRSDRRCILSTIRIHKQTSTALSSLFLQAEHWLLNDGPSCQVSLVCQSPCVYLCRPWGLNGTPAPCREAGEHQNSPGGRCRVKIYCELSSTDAAQTGEDPLCTINKNTFKAFFTDLFSSWFGTAEGIQIIIFSNY